MSKLHLMTIIQSDTVKRICKEKCGKLESKMIDYMKMPCYQCRETNCPHERHAINVEDKIVFRKLR